VVLEADDVVEVDAQAAVAQSFQPAVLVDELKAVQDLGVAHVVPVAGDGRRVVGQQLLGLVRVGDLVVVVAVLQAHGDAQASGLVGQLAQAGLGGGQVGRCSLGPLAAAVGAQELAAVGVDLAKVEELAKLLLGGQHLVPHAAEVDDHAAGPHFGRPVEGRGGDGHRLAPLLLVRGGQVRSLAVAGLDRGTAVELG
jgi:hypothetical protein